MLKKEWLKLILEEIKENDYFDNEKEKLYNQIILNKINKNDSIDFLKTAHIAHKQYVESIIKNEMHYLKYTLSQFKQEKENSLRKTIELLS